MEKLECCLASQIDNPSSHINEHLKEADKSKLKWFLDNYSQAIGTALMRNAGEKIIKEFEENPSHNKIFSFKLICEEMIGIDSD